MVEQQLRHYPFLVAGKFTLPCHGYTSHDEYCTQLHRQAYIGRFNSKGEFIEDPSLFCSYENEIPFIANTLIQPNLHPNYRKFKVAEIHKGSLDVYLEEGLAQKLGKTVIRFQQMEHLRRTLHVQPLLVDLGGPCYQLFWPETLDTALEYFQTGDRQPVLLSLHIPLTRNTKQEPFTMTAKASGF